MHLSTHLRFKPILKALISGLMLCILSTPVVWAEAIHDRQFRDWRGVCAIIPDNQQVCYLEQNVYDNNRLLATVIVGYPPGATLPTALLELPANIAIDRGLTLSIDRADPIALEGFCEEDLCHAGINMDDSLLELFRQGRLARVDYYPDETAEVVRLPISLMGISAGLNALQRL